METYCGWPFLHLAVHAPALHQALLGQVDGRAAHEVIAVARPLRVPRAPRALVPHAVAPGTSIDRTDVDDMTTCVKVLRAKAKAESKDQSQVPTGSERFLSEPMIGRYLLLCFNIRRRRRRGAQVHHTQTVRAFRRRRRILCTGAL
jgi:hypothetical protein